MFFLGLFFYFTLGLRLTAAWPARKFYVERLRLLVFIELLLKLVIVGQYPLNFRLSET